MVKQTVQVVFEGQLVPGADPASVKANLAKLFKLELAKVEPLFSGRRVVIKRELDEATARKYQTALERAGAVVEVVAGAADDAANAPPTLTDATRASSPPAGPADTAEPGPSRADLAEAGRAPPPLASRPVPSAPGDMSMADPGALLVDGPSAVEAPDIDTSHLTLSAPGADLTEPKNVTAPEYDLSAFELAPPGATLADSDST